MSLPKLISLIRSNELQLIRLDNFTDPYEGSTTARTAAGIDAFLKQMSPPGGYHEMFDIYRKNRKSMFVSCWHANEHESEAMWRLYGASDGGIAIQSTYAKLVESIAEQPDLYIGLVSYADYRTASFPDANVFYPVMHKRLSFAHEREVRLVRMSVAPQDGETPAMLVLPWNVEAYCENVYVDPYAPAYYFEALRAVLETMAPPLLPRLQWSQMKADPVF